VAGLGVVDAVCSTDRTGDCATGVCPDAAAEEGASLGGGTGVVGSTMFGAVWPSLALTPWLLPVTISRSSASGCKCGSGGFKVVPAFSLPAGWVVVAEMSLTAYRSENAKVNMVNGVDSIIKCSLNQTKQLTSQSTALKAANNLQRMVLVSVAELTISPSPSAPCCGPCVCEADTSKSPGVSAVGFERMVIPHCIAFIACNRIDTQ
jgi:hypothetical protein